MFHGKLHHVGIIVPDAERVEEFCRLCGMSPGRRQYVPQYEAECIFTQGACGVIEFIIPRGGKLAQFNKGIGGLHHIAIEVEDLQATMTQLAADGVRLLESSPVDAGELWINFLPPVYSRGVTIEYVQTKKQTAASAAES